MTDSYIPIYHLTDINNLNSILERKGLFAKCLHQDLGIEHTDVAYTDLQNRRHISEISCAPGGNLHNYIPFYFAPRSPMLYTINQGNVAQYQSGQESLIYLVSSVEKVLETNLLYIFTDRHPLHPEVNFYNDADVLNQVDWSVMGLKYWTGKERKSKRQAEFLTFGYFPMENIHEIGVLNLNTSIKAIVITRLQGWSINIKIRPEWYF